MNLLLSVSLVAQQLAKEDVYRIKVVTKSGDRFWGILSDVTESTLYLAYGKRAGSGIIPFDAVRKVVIRRDSKKNALITGAVIGGLLTGFAANQSLQKNQVRTNVSYGLTLTFAAAGGAAGGLLVGSAIGNIKSIVIRPLKAANPELTLFRQLKPFTWRYQQDVINRLPQTPQ